MFLECGVASWDSIRKFCSHNLVSITCDMGTEMGIGLLPAEVWDIPELLPNPQCQDDTAAANDNIFFEPEPQLESYDVRK